MTRARLPLGENATRARQRRICMGAINATLLVMGAILAIACWFKLALWFADQLTVDFSNDCTTDIECELTDGRPL